MDPPESSGFLHGVQSGGLFGEPSLSFIGLLFFLRQDADHQLVQPTKEVRILCRVSVSFSIYHHCI